MDSALMQEFGIQQNTTAPAESVGINHPSGGIVDLNSRVEQVFGTADPTPSAQPNGQQPPNPANPQNPPAPQQTPPQGQQPPASAQPPAPATDPGKAFAEGSPKAFFTQTGDLDSAKINDFFLTNGKSFMKLAETSPIDTPKQTAPVERADPLKEYNEKLAYMAEHLDQEIAKRQSEGATPEQINQEIREYYAGLRAELKTRKDLRKAIEEQTQNLAPELEQARQDRVNAAISRNVMELSQGLENLVQGLTGQQVLNQFMLDPKYGGLEIDRQYKLANPEANNLDLRKPEDAAKNTELSKKWFREFQQDRRAMAHVAEFGRLRWMVENFKPILEHAQKVGAQKVANGNEAAIGAPSKIVNPPLPGQKNDFDKFFGVDSVN